jgi:hypothetical protein
MVSLLRSKIQKGVVVQTVFSHIIQKRYSQSYEDIATDALAYILTTYKSSYNEMMKFLRGILPGLPDIQFQTQVGEGAIRPDMWGYRGLDTFVYIENKFWAGLTENQPVSYLYELANHSQPTLLLMIVPGAREQMMIGQLTQRLQQAEVQIIPTERKPKECGLVRQNQHWPNPGHNLLEQAAE